MYRPNQPPEPEAGWRVIMPGIAERTFHTQEDAETALRTAHALGIEDAYVVRVGTFLDEE